MAFKCVVCTHGRGSAVPSHVMCKELHHLIFWWGLAVRWGTVFSGITRFGHPGDLWESFSAKMSNHFIHWFGQVKLHRCSHQMETPSSPQTNMNLLLSLPVTGTIAMARGSCFLCHQPKFYGTIHEPSSIYRWGLLLSLHWYKVKGVW